MYFFSLYSLSLSIPHYVIFQSPSFDLSDCNGLLAPFGGERNNISELIFKNHCASLFYYYYFFLPSPCPTLPVHFPFTLGVVLKLRNKRETYQPMCRPIHNS